MCKEPHERARLYFLLAWFHAIIQERLRYAPLGWAKKYEFNESDLRMACDTLDTWLETVAQVLYLVMKQITCTSIFISYTSADDAHFMIPVCLNDKLNVVNIFP